jgi:hypothetical protein
VLLSLLSLVSAGLSDYTHYPTRIGPKSQQGKNQTLTQCTNKDTCPAQAAAACDATKWCHSFAVRSDEKNVHTAELYAADASTSLYNAQWELWAKGGVPPPPGPGPSTMYSCNKLTKTCTPDKTSTTTQYECEQACGVAPGPAPSM